MRSPPQVKNTRAKRKAIGVLDIYGFEILQDNSFEQFIINYCNEKLQQIFIQLTLEGEQAEYVREGIPWENIDYFDNSIICKLIEGKGGLLKILDDHCLRPEGRTNDAKWLEQLNMDRSIIDHAHFQTRKKRGFETDKTIEQEDFRIVHYAGPVTYYSDQFITKNKDTLFVDIARFMYKCGTKLSLLKTLFKDGKTLNGGGSTGKRPMTLGTQFKVNIALLMKNLASKNPHYIRCIKPNEKKAKQKFDHDMGQHQVRYLGLLENIKVRRAGYAFRLEYEKFLERYKMLSAITWPVWKGSPREGCKHMLEDFGASRTEAAWGRTKIFIRSPRTLFSIEDARKLKIIEIVTKVQAKWRGFVQLRAFTEIKKGANTIAAHFKGMRRRKKFLATREGAILVTSFFRMWRERRRFEEHQVKIVMIKAAFVITAWGRGFYVRQIKANVCGRIIMGGTNKLFRRNAGPLLVRNLVAYQRRAFLQRVAKNLPSDSPTGPLAVPAAPAQKKAAAVIEDLYRQWRNLKYRTQINTSMQAIMREKLVSSFLFRGKKSSYPGSVSTMFLGDQLLLDNDETGTKTKWEAAAKLVDQQASQILVALQLIKVHRRNGKEVERNFVVTDTAFVMLDQKMQFKYHVLLAEIKAITCSTHGDGYFVLHVDWNPNKGKNKGDHLYHSADVIEIITRIYIAVFKKEGRHLQVNVDDNFKIQIKQKQQEYEVNVAQGDGEDGAVKYQKRGKMVIQIPEVSFTQPGASKRGGEQRAFMQAIINDLKKDATPAPNASVSLPRTTSEPALYAGATPSGDQIPAQASAPATSTERAMKSAPNILASAPATSASPPKPTRGRGRGRGGRGYVKCALCACSVAEANAFSDDCQQAHAPVQ